MSTASSRSSIRCRPSRHIRLGFLALTDAAPLIVAHEHHIFSRYGLSVELQREIGWATLREKIIYGELDAAPAPAPMLWSMQLGLGCKACDVLTAHVLSLQGNALTLSESLWQAGVRDAAGLRDHLRVRSSRSPITLGVVFTFSSHYLLLREWLGMGGADLPGAVRLVVVPPDQMCRHLAAGTIDGFYAGEPWNTAAVRAGIGWCPITSAVQQPGHVEKVLAVTSRFAETYPEQHAALVAALLEAGAWCDEPQNREPLAELLAQPRYLNLPIDVVAPALTGRFESGHGRIENTPLFHRFHQGDANVPHRPQAEALQRALAGAGLLPAAAGDDARLPRRLFREDLHRRFLELPLHANTKMSDLHGLVASADHSG